MSTTPPPQPGQYGPGDQTQAMGGGTSGPAGGSTTTAAGGGGQGGLGQRPSSSYGGGPTSYDVARLPIPGNAELAVWLLALVVAGIVALAADRFDVNGWMNFFLWTTVAYLLSRGIAKATRVLEQ